MASKMMVKFEKYWNITCIPLAMAAIFDLRLKYKLLEYYFPLLYSDDSNARITEVKQGLMNLYTEYTVGSTNNPFDKGFSWNDESNSGAMRSLNVPSTNEATMEWDDGLNLFLQESSSFERKFDFDLYLEEATHPMRKGEGFDVLAWWRLNAPKYRDVARMARDILAILVSTVASESAFSTGGRTIDDYRSKLLPETQESLMYTQDWLRNEKKKKIFNHTFILSRIPPKLKLQIKKA